MKTSVIAATALVALLVAGVAAVAVANQTNTQNNTQGQHEDHDEDHGEGQPQACISLTTNQTLTVSGLRGHFVSFAGNSTTNGNASGSFSFKLGQSFVRGCTLTLTGGSFTLGNTTYTVTGGSLVLSFGGHAGIGSGTTSAGSFLIGIGGLHEAQVNSTSPSVGAIRLDFKSGSSEYLVILGSPESDE